MTAVLSVLTILLSVSVFLLFGAACLWAFTRYRITFPIWLVFAPLCSAFAGRAFAEESSMLLFHMTDVLGLSAESATLRLNGLTLASTSADACSKLLIALIGISELVAILNQTGKPPTGLWNRFKSGVTKRVAFGATALSLAALSTGMAGLYYHTL